MKEEYRGNTQENESKILVPEIRNITKYKDKKLIAFTFDDGPNTSKTNIILDNLDKYMQELRFLYLEIELIIIVRC